MRDSPGCYSSHFLSAGNKVNSPIVLFTKKQKSTLLMIYPFNDSCHKCFSFFMKVQQKKKPAQKMETPEEKT